MVPRHNGTFERHAQQTRYLVCKLVAGQAIMFVCEQIASGGIGRHRTRNID